MVAEGDSAAPAAEPSEATALVASTPASGPGFSAPIPSSSDPSAEGSSATKKKKKNKKKKKKGNQRQSIFKHVQVARSTQFSRALRAAVEAVEEPLEGKKEEDEEKDAEQEDPLARKINRRTEDPFAFRLVDLGDGDGRRVVARRPVAEGELLLQEIPYVWCVYPKSFGVVCNVCATRIGQVHRTIGSSCGQCKRMWCSPACAKTGANHHNLGCGITRMLPEIQSAFDMDEDILSICLEFMLEQVLPTNLPTPGSGNIPAPWFRSSLEDVLTMADHPLAKDVENSAVAAAGRLCEVMNKAISDANEDLRSKFKAGMVFHPEEIVRFIRIVNSNSHQLSTPLTFVGGEGGEVGYGVGIFPLGAMFNHSCQPNSIYSSASRPTQIGHLDSSEPSGQDPPAVTGEASTKGSKPSGASAKSTPLPPQLTFRALQTCSTGEELCVSYIDLYLSRSDRSSLLWTQKHFVCRCSRCTLSPKSSEEAETFLHDRFVGGILCPHCNAAGRTNPEAVLAERKLPGDHALVVLRRGLKQNAFGGQTPELPGGTGGEQDEGIIETLCVQCEQDTTQFYHETAASLKLLAARAAEYYFKSLNHHSHEHGESCNHDHGDSPSKAFENFSSLVTTAESMAHPDHESIYHLLHPWANLANRAQEFEQRHHILKRLIESSRKQWPQHFLPLAQMYMAVSHAIAAVIREKKSGRMVPKKMLLRLREQRLGYIQKAIRVLEVCRGPSDESTENVRKHLAAAQQERV